jgi:hypothetical protein
MKWPFQKSPSATLDFHEVVTTFIVNAYLGQVKIKPVRRADFILDLECNPSVLT